MANQNKAARRAARNEKPSSKEAPVVKEAPAVETAAPEAKVETTAAPEAPVASAEQAPAPAPTTEAAPAPAPEPAKVSWEDTMKKAQASFAKTGSFREGTNRAILYPLLNREEGLSLSEAAAATLARGGKPRNLSSIHTDLHDIAKITTRKLVRCDKGDQKRYRLAPLPPAQPVQMTEEKKEDVKA